jgi:predicted dehydrogenase
VRRFAAEFVKIQRLLHENFLGSVLDVRIQGKQNARVGGEDMIVLGTHDFDIMRWYFGDPQWVSASVTDRGKPIEKQNVRKANEPILVAGDTIRATFGFPNNISVRWDSIKTNDSWNKTSPAQGGKWGFVIAGSQRTIVYRDGIGTRFLDSPFLTDKENKQSWRELPDPKNWPIPSHERGPIVNLIHAIENNSEPLCSGRDGRWAVEMVAGVYESERTDRRVSFPLKDRSNPLLRF